MWVMDFGAMKEVKEFLSYYFDHTFLASLDDPALEKFQALDEAGIIQLRVLHNAGMEGTAQFVYEEVSKIIHKQTQGRVRLTMVEVRENEKNSAMYLA